MAGRFCSLHTWKLPVIAVFLCASAFAQRHTGIPARSEPEDYAVQASTTNGTYAASVLPADQVKHLFSADISKKYVVIELACYPRAGAEVNIDPDSFVIRGNSNSEIVRPTDAVTVARDIRPDRNRAAPSGPSDIYTEANVGYETGTDPYSGRRVHGVYGGGGVGVGRGVGPQYPPPPDRTQDREVLEDQLSDKGVPSGRFDRPVSGYLYFPATVLRKQKTAVYHVTYLAETARPFELSVPAKSR